jgi:hypothetical protein
MATCGHSVLPVASVSLTLLALGLRVLPTVLRKGAAHVITLLDPALLVSANESLISVRLNKFSFAHFLDPLLTHEHRRIVALKLTRRTPSVPRQTSETSTCGTELANARELRTLPSAPVSTLPLAMECGWSSSAVMQQHNDKEPEDVPFDPSMLPASPALKRLVSSALVRIGEVEDRRRNRREADARNFKAAVSALITNLVHRHLSKPSGWLMVPLAKAALSAEVRPASFMTKTFAATAKLLQRAGIAELRIGTKSKEESRQSTMRAGPWLLDRMPPGEYGFKDIGRDEKLLGDPLILRSRKVAGDNYDLPLPNTDEVRRLRREMHAINAWIAQADLQWTGKPVDTGRRFLKRIFNDGSLQRGGRMYHAFWITESSTDRLAHLLIDGQPIASLDYSQMGIRLAYSDARAPLPKGDLYDVGMGWPREGVKQVLNALLSADELKKQFPQGTRVFFTRRLRFAIVLKAISARHPALVKLFGTAQALAHQRIESEIIVRCLLALKDMGVVALPVHDSLLVPFTHRRLAKEVMERIFREVTGREGKVKVSPLRRLLRRNTVGRSVGGSQGKGP